MVARRAAHRVSACPAFLEFARGSVLVAHNAGFDIGFLKAAAAAHRAPVAGVPACSTRVHLARQLVMRDEARNHKLSSLAAVFGATTTPDHRALHDARATVDVLHGLHRAGRQPRRAHPRGARRATRSRVTPAQRRKRFLAEDLPPRAGRLPLQGRAAAASLYVGTSRNIRTRVRTYFTASEQRTRMAEMVAARRERHADRVPDHARGPGPRAAAHRRAQAPLQPALQGTPSGPCGSS